MDTKEQHTTSSLGRTIRDIQRPQILINKNKPRGRNKVIDKIKSVVKDKKRYSQILLVALIILIGLFAYNYSQTRSQLKKLADPKTATEQEAIDLANLIGKYLELPQDETPSIATVKNASQLTDQSFFSRTRNGDKVLIYPEAGKAVLYRPSTKMVIEYASVRLKDPSVVDQ